MLSRFATLDRRLTAAVSSHLSNATVALSVGGPVCPAQYERRVPEASPFAEVTTVPAHIVRLCLAGIGDVAEGQQLVVTTAHWPAGQLCRITTPVEPDESGWAEFDVVALS